MLEELQRRVEEAERQFQAQDLDLQLRDLEAAKQRQVNILNYFSMLIDSQLNIAI